MKKQKGLQKLKPKESEWEERKQQTATAFPVWIQSQPAKSVEGKEQDYYRTFPTFLFRNRESGGSEEGGSYIRVVVVVEVEVVGWDEMGCETWNSFLLDAVSFSSTSFKLDNIWGGKQGAELNWNHTINYKLVSQTYLLFRHFVYAQFWKWSRKGKRMQKRERVGWNDAVA